MTREEYLAAKAAMLGYPPRHPIVGGMQPTSVAELDSVARSLGFDPVRTSAQEAEPALVPSTPAPTVATPSHEQTSSEPASTTPAIDDSQGPTPPTVTLTAEPHNPASMPPQSATPSSGKTELPATPKANEPKVAVTPPAASTSGQTPPAKPAIPENVGTLTYNQLRSLAKDLGVSPVPKVQAELIECIEKAREGAV